MLSSVGAFDSLLNRLRSAGVPIVRGLPDESLDLESCFLDESGSPVGLVYEGKIFLRPDTCSLSVLSHEYAHLWAAWYRHRFPTAWEAWVCHSMRLPLFYQLAEVTCWTDRNRLADECLAVMVGKAVVWSSVAEAVVSHWVSLVLSGMWAGFRPEGVVDAWPRCFFIGLKGARRLRRYDPVPYQMLSRARLLKRRGRAASLVKLETGWEQGVDLYWRFETNDYSLRAESACRQALERPMLLKELLDLPVVYQAYPSLGNFKVIMQELAHTGHVAQIGADFILLDREMVCRYLDCWDDKELCGGLNLAYYLLHEIQHGIQRFEGFSKGTAWFQVGRCQSPAMMRINEIDPAIFSLGCQVVLTNPLETLIKGGLSDLRDKREISRL